MTKFNKGDFVRRGDDVFVVTGALSDDIEIVKITYPAGGFFSHEDPTCYSLVPPGEKVIVGNALGFEPGKVVRSVAGQIGLVCHDSTMVFVTSGKDQWSCQPLVVGDWWHP